MKKNSDYKYGICLIICYFGRFPEYFELFKMTCKYNPSVDFIIYTDQELKKLPQNIIIRKCKLDDIKQRCKAIFPYLNISLDRPYKLCDYKPAYGEIFEDEIKEYDFWGHCDIDILFGNIRKFLTEEILDSYDKIFGDGQFSLIRNSKESNRRYRSLDSKGCQSYSDVFQSNANRAFDEWAEHMGWGVPRIYERNGMAVYKEQVYQDISFLNTDFIDSFGNQRDRQCYYFEEGTLKSYCLENNRIISREYLYCHFQKRIPMIKKWSDRDSILLAAPNKAYVGVNDEIFYNIAEYKKYNSRHINVAPIIFQFNKLNKWVKLPINEKIIVIKNKLFRFNLAE